MKDKDSSIEVDADEAEEGLEPSSEPSSEVPSVPDESVGPSFVRGPDGRIVDSQ